jgi:hypothetical protein
MLDLLWEEFTGPLGIAATKLWVAAHDDPKVDARIASVERELSTSVRRLLREQVDGPATEEFDQRVAVAFNAVRGVALSFMFAPAERDRGDPWPHHRRELERFLSG